MSNIVICMKWGTKYGSEYVNRLYNMVKRHTTVDFKMVCLTDRTEGINPEVQCFPIPPLALPEGHLSVAGISYLLLNRIYMF